MAFNGSGSVGVANVSSGGSSSSGNQDGPLNKRLCTGKENNDAGINSNRVRMEDQINFYYYINIV